jgi:Domain of unknown function (DUF4390)
MQTTTAFTTRCCKKPDRRQRFFDPWQCLCALLVSLVVATSSVVNAQPTQPAQLKSVKLEATDDGLQINADFDVELSPMLLETVRRGVPLYFVVEVEISRGRWYWLDDLIASAQRERRVAYAPLSEQYRVTTAGISQNLSSADDIKRVLSRIRSWTIADKSRLKPGEKYEAAIRFRLDTSKLPKPFQLNTFGSRQWNLATDWHRWTINVNKDGGLSP